MNKNTHGSQFERGLLEVFEKRQSLAFLIPGHLFQADRQVLQAHVDGVQNVFERQPDQIGLVQRHVQLFGHVLGLLDPRQYRVFEPFVQLFDVDFERFVYLRGDGGKNKIVSVSFFVLAIDDGRWGRGGRSGYTGSCA